MLNKKGFTLLEVTISIALLSVVMVFMFRLLNIVRKDENAISLTTELLLNKSILSKNLNESIKNRNGISNSSCTETTCTLTMKDGKELKLELTNNRTILTLTNITDNKKELSRKLPDNFKYKLRRVVESYEEYNIDIVDQKVN